LNGAGGDLDSMRVVPESNVTRVPPDAGQTRATPLEKHRSASKLGQDLLATDSRRAIMALRFLGKDPDSEHGSSPTVWEDGDTGMPAPSASAAG
jgi:hypothetical protein